MLVGGPMADRWQSRPPVVLGMSIGAASLAFLALLPPSAGTTWVLLGLAVSGLGIGVSLPAMHRAAMLPVTGALLGVAAGMYSMIRFVGDTLGTALSGTILQTAMEKGAPAGSCPPDGLLGGSRCGVHRYDCRLEAARVEPSQPITT